MEQIIREIEAYSKALGVPPERVLRRAIGASWGQWEAWVSGTASCTVRTLERLRRYMAENPAPSMSPQSGEAA